MCARAPTGSDCQYQHSVAAHSPGTPTCLQHNRNDATRATHAPAKLKPHLRLCWQHHIAQSPHRRCPTPADQAGAMSAVGRKLQCCLPCSNTAMQHVPPHAPHVTRRQQHTGRSICGILLTQRSVLHAELPPVRLPHQQPLTCMSQKGAAAGANVRQAPTDRSSATEAGVSVDTRRSA